MGTLLHRIGAWCFRRHWQVLASWLLLIVALAALAFAVKVPPSGAITVPGTESQRAIDLLNKEFPGTGGAQAQVVFSVPGPAALTAPAYRRAIEATLARLRKAPQVVAVLDPFTTGTVSKSGLIAYATVAYPVPVYQVTPAARQALLASGGPAKAAGITVEYGGQVAQASTVSDTEVVGLLIAFLVLLLGFGSIFSALLPLVAAIAGVAVTSLALSALTPVLSETTTTSILAVMIGLAVGIDYSLLVMNRFRQQLVEGMPAADAAGLAVATAGTAVCFAGTTVLIALAALAIVAIPFLTTMGLAAAGAVVVAVAVTLTLVPALLAVVGTRMIAGGLARRQIARTTAPGYRPMARRYVGLLARGAGVVVLAVAAVLLLVASPALHLRLGLPDAGSQPANQTTRQAYDLISKGFGPGANGPLLVVAYVPGGPTAAQVTAFADYYRSVSEKHPADVAAIGPPIVNPKHDLALVTVVPDSGPNDTATEQLIDRIRQIAAEGQRQYGIQTYVTGQTALNVDVSAKLSAALPIYLAVIVLLCLLLLLVVFRSLLVPLKAVVGYVLSLLATLGTVTFVFQEGHLDGLFGVARAGPVLSFLPIILLGVLFGLAMDYEVFLVARMREEFNRSDDAGAAVVDGYASTAKVVASAGVIMISVFASFIFSDDPTTKSLGFSLALGVLLDAFVVRMTLVPAVMSLLGRAAWWLPARLGRVIPRLDVEGEVPDQGPVAAPS